MRVPTSPQSCSPACVYGTLQAGWQLANVPSEERDRICEELGITRSQLQVGAGGGGLPWWGPGMEGSPGGARGWKATLVGIGGGRLPWWAPGMEGSPDGRREWRAPLVGAPRVWGAGCGTLRVMA